MKKTRLASKSGQSTTGSRLLGWRGVLFDWRQILTIRQGELGASPEGEIRVADRDAEITESNLPVILHEAVLEHFRAERGQNGTSAVQSGPGMPATSSLLPGSDGAGTPGVNSCNSATVATTLLFETRLPRSKRIVDLGILACTFPVWLPLMALITGLVKIASPGPAFYRQRRVGFRGKEFMIFKFRSMHVNAETQAHEKYVEQLMEVESPMTKLDASDSRLIPCGRFLRATGLDELPQLFNILRGEMSFVGPRPCTVIEYQRYRPEHRARVNAPPGLTGFWQVNGKNRTTFNEMIAMDIFYAENMSLRLDLRIMWKTLPAIVRQTRESSAAARARRVSAKAETVDSVTANFQRFRERT